MTRASDTAAPERTETIATDCAASPAGWQPIESAPREGKFLLAIFPPTSSEYGVRLVWLSASDSRRRRELQLMYATHYMPLPAPPERAP